MARQFLRIYGHFASRSVQKGLVDNMKNKLLIAIPAVVIILAALIIFFLYTPDISIAVSKPADPQTKSYVCTPMLAVSARFGLPLPSGIKKQITEFTERTNAAAQEIRDNCGKPMKTNASVKLDGGMTVVTYYGTTSGENGAEVPYDNKLVFDFVLTKDINAQ